MNPWWRRRLHDCVYWSSRSIWGFSNSLRVIGRGNVPRTGPFLMVSNHVSFMDPVLVGLASPRYLAYIARHTLFKHRILSWLIRNLDAIGINNEGTGKGGLEEALKILRSGTGVVVFAEGTRSPDGQLQPFEAGLSLLLKKANVPVVPVGIVGAFEALPRNRRLPRFSWLFGTPTNASIAISVGKPIPAHTFAGMARLQMVSTVRDGVQQEIERARKLQRR